MGKGVLEILMDTETSKENVFRLARQAGWDVEIKRNGDDYRLILKKD
jgi:TusA-related sulfurtransferase